MRSLKKLTVAGATAVLLGAATLGGGAYAHSGSDEAHHGTGMGMGMMPGRMGMGMGMMPGRIGPMGRGGPAAMLQKLDLDGDGKVTREEALEARAKELEKYDTNGDGKLTVKEYEQIWLDYTRPMMVRRFQMHDTDADGRVTREEFGAIVDRMFWRMDRNGDGVIARDEMRGMGGWMRNGPERRHDRDGDEG